MHEVNPGDLENEEMNSKHIKWMMSFQRSQVHSLRNINNGKATGLN